jgi:hypothetical protein
LRGDRTLGAANPVRPKAKEIIIAIHQMLCPENSGKRAISRKTIAKTKPNARSVEPTSSCFEFSIIYYSL